MIGKRLIHIEISGLLFLMALGMSGCATPAGVAERNRIMAAQGVSIDRLLRTAVAAGEQMGYSVRQEANRLFMEKSLPLGSGYFIPSAAKHRNRITVSVFPDAASGTPEVQVEGEYLGDPRDQDIRNCVPCDVNQIKKALKEAR